MTDAELDRINAERRRRGRPALTRAQATNAVIASPQRYDDGFNTSDFLIASAMHASPSANDPVPDPSSAASHDYSPSYDSGGASGGSDGGGGGGGGE